MNKKLYISLEKDQIEEHTPRLFHLSSISKEFKSIEILCPHRASLPTPFPFLQEDLYQAHQPGNLHYIIYIRYLNKMILFKNSLCYHYSLIFIG